IDIETVDVEDGFDGALHVTRGWSQPHLVSYMESHDEERLMVRTLSFGNSSGGYNTRNLETALDRLELSAAFLLTMPGPKMIWQFGEVGYDYSINYCGDGSINNNCRTDAKPIRWDYLQVPGRNDLFNVYQGLLHLRKKPLYAEAFTVGNISRNFSGGIKWMTINSSAGKVVVVGNFDVVQQTASVTFPAAGTWYDYLRPPATFIANGAPQSITLQPGEYHVYLSTNVVLPVTLLSFTGKAEAGFNRIQWQVENEELSHYELERSADGLQFVSISNITAMGSRSYEVEDNDVNQAPVYFYRLKQVDKDGRFTYSATIKVTRAVKAGSIAATPNPFDKNLRVNITVANKEVVALRLTDLTGRQLFTQNVPVHAGENIIRLDEASRLSAGTYFLTMTAAGQQSTIRILKSN
ncbi:MAG: T9SS type A sorting domain-containing protein, partial [Sphingobacteriales bacterium]